MNESLGTLKAALDLRSQHELLAKPVFCEYAIRRYEVDIFTAELFYELIEATEGIMIMRQNTERRVK